MPKLIERKISDFDGQINSLVARYIRRYVDEYQDKNNTTRDAVAKKVGISQGRLSQLLGSGATNDETMYRKILSVCGYRPQIFDDVLEKAKREILWSAGGDDIDYALSSDLWNNAEAVNEVKWFMQFVKQKYQIKK